MRKNIVCMIAAGVLALAVAAPTWAQYENKDKSTANKTKTPTTTSDKTKADPEDVFDARKELQDARKTMEELTKIPEDGIPKAMLDDAAAIVIVPNVIKAGVVAGGRHGDGVLLVRGTGVSGMGSMAGNTGTASTGSSSSKEDPSSTGNTSNPGDAPSTTPPSGATGNLNAGWSAPIFVELTGASIGAQAGVESTDLVLVFKNESAAQKLLDGEFTLGADGSVAVGPVGRDMSAGTGAKLDHEIYSYSRAQGVFVGVALEGNKISIDKEDNAAYYGTSFTDAKTFARTTSSSYPPDAVTFMNDFNRFVSGSYDKTKTDMDKKNDINKSNTKKTQG
jgi:lipid-binding SYLF domain-containing protein